MLYNWSGAAYRSPQIDVAPVIVRDVRVIRITHRADDGMIYAYGKPNERLLHETEGFATREELDSWFRPIIKRGQTVEKALMFFSLSNTASHVTRNVDPLVWRCQHVDDVPHTAMQDGATTAWTTEPCQRMAMVNSDYCRIHAWMHGEHVDPNTVISKTDNQPNEVTK